MAHPDLVPIARPIFEEGLQGRLNQKERIPEVDVKPSDLINFKIPGGQITQAGVRDMLVWPCNMWRRGCGATAQWRFLTRHGRRRNRRNLAFTALAVGTPPRWQIE